MVPIVNSSIAAEKVSVWNERSGFPRPQRALWITNSTGMTLDGGSFSVLEDDTFAGEGIFDPIRPGEKRLASYAMDLALNVSSYGATDRERISRVRISKGLMIHESEIREKKTYTIRNEDTSARSVLVEHPVRSGYRLTGTLQPVETTDNWRRFRLQVEPKQTATLTVEESSPRNAQYKISDITSDQIALFRSERSISPNVEAALREIVARQGALSALENRRQLLEGESMSIVDDQQRLRENMKALKASPEEKPILQRYLTQLNTQESRLEQIRQESKALDEQIEAAMTALDGEIQSMSLDERL
jgi:hypothetical protein